MSMHHEQGYPHAHPKQPDIEDAPFTEYQVMAGALEELLIEKKVFTADGMRNGLEGMAAASPANGARLVARCWVDPTFEARVLRSVNDAAVELGLTLGQIPIHAVKNTPQVHHVIVCTLCSCYPIALLGGAPDWYKSRAYRARVVREPRAVLEEFGTHLPDDVEVRVHDSTAERRYVVIPMRPAGTEGMTEADLAACVTRDCMIGTSLPRVPQERPGA
jgi:nitrile hydratase subunit alpha